MVARKIKFASNDKTEKKNSKCRSALPEVAQPKTQSSILGDEEETLSRTKEGNVRSGGGDFFTNRIRLPLEVADRIPEYENVDDDPAKGNEYLRAKIDQSFWTPWCKGQGENSPRQQLKKQAGKMYQINTQSTWCKIHIWIFLATSMTDFLANAKNTDEIPDLKPSEILESVSDRIENPGNIKKFEFFDLFEDNKITPRPFDEIDPLDSGEEVKGNN